MKLRQMIGIGVLVALVGSVAALVFIRPQVAESPAHRLSISTTIYPLYEVVKQVGGDKVAVTNITPPGVEPHDYEPTPQQLATISKSAMVVHNGTMFEPWLGKFLSDYLGVKVSASTGLSLKPAYSDENGELITGVYDPHYWLDPVLMQTVTDTIQKSLADADPDNASYYAERAAAYRQKLVALDELTGRSLARCQVNTIVTAHSAFAYFAERYGLKQVAIAGLGPDAEPTAAQLASLAELVRREQLSYIFFESLTSPKLAETLAKETGIKTAVLDPIEGLTDADQKAGKTYLSIQEENVVSLRRSLTCR